MNQSRSNQSKINQSIKSLLLCSITCLLASGIAIAQVNKNSELYKNLKAKDSILFKIGFNGCEIEKSAMLMSDDLEFYHDKSGITNSKEEFVATMKNGLCKPNNPEKTFRFLVKGSLAVFPMYNNGQLYGALQNGKHFFSPNPSMTFEETNNYALFSHLWIIEDEEWKLKRVISYNHVPKDIKRTIKTVIVNKDILNLYKGTYLTKKGEALISIKDNTLLLTSGDMTFELESRSETLFTNPQAPLSFEFVKNSKGKVIKMLVRENDKIVEEGIKNNK